MSFIDGMKNEWKNANILHKSIATILIVINIFVVINFCSSSFTLKKVHQMDNFARDSFFGCHVIYESSSEEYDTILVYQTFFFFFKIMPGGRILNNGDLEIITGVIG